METQKDKLQYPNKTITTTALPNTTHQTTVNRAYIIKANKKTTG
jgi:hypothetical protein